MPVTEVATLPLTHKLTESAVCPTPIPFTLANPAFLTANPPPISNRETPQSQSRRRGRIRIPIPIFPGS